MKFANFKYDISRNVGDYIQSLAIEQFLPKVTMKFDRNTLREVSENEKYVMIMQGWFSESPERCFPPSDSIIPVFFGFHITDLNGNFQHFLNPPSISYLKSHEPIGCRDRKTMEMLTDKGVDAFYSKCLTLTFPKRTEEPKNGKIFLVDTNQVQIIPEEISNTAITISHLVSPYWGDEINTLIAKKLLELYRNEARLIITTRLHCALPCVAMGIPVIFFGNPNDYRISILKDLNIPIYPLMNPLTKKTRSLLRNCKNTILRFLVLHGLVDTEKPLLVDWNPKPTLIDQEKIEIINRLQNLLHDKISNI